jgi:hypothetical protein
MLWEGFSRAMCLRANDSVITIKNARRARAAFCQVNHLVVGIFLDAADGACL